MQMFVSEAFIHIKTPNHKCQFRDYCNSIAFVCVCVLCVLFGFLLEGQINCKFANTIDSPPSVERVHMGIVYGGTFFALPDVGAVSNLKITRNSFLIIRFFSTYLQQNKIIHLNYFNLMNYHR